jgi:hypothetical protein
MSTATATIAIESSAAATAAGKRKKPKGLQQQQPQQQPQEECGALASEGSPAPGPLIQPHSHSHHHHQQQQQQQPPLPLQQQQPQQFSPSPLIYEDRAKRIDEMFHGLKTLASIKEGDKVCSRQGTLSVISNSAYKIITPFPCIYRTFWRENRAANLVAIQELLQQAFDFIQATIVKHEQEVKSWASSPSSSSSSAADDPQPAAAQQQVPRMAAISCFRNRKFIDRAITAVISAKAGLKMLAKTYESDPRTVAKIDLLQDRIDDHLLEFQISLSYFPPAE